MTDAGCRSPFEQERQQRRETSDLVQENRPSARGKPTGARAAKPTMLKENLVAAVSEEEDQLDDLVQRVGRSTSPRSRPGGVNSPLIYTPDGTSWSMSAAPASIRTGEPISAMYLLVCDQSRPRSARIALVRPLWPAISPRGVPKP